MRFDFEYTGLRVRNLDAAVEFFTKVLGMELEGRIQADWNKGEYANLRSANGKHRLELNWYASDSPLAGPFREGDELDHLGFATDDFDGALRRLAEAGTRPPSVPSMKATGTSRSCRRSRESGSISTTWTRNRANRKPGRKPPDREAVVRRRRRLLRHHREMPPGRPERHRTVHQGQDARHGDPRPNTHER